MNQPKLLIQGTFIFADDRVGRYRARRGEDLTIWEVEIVSDEGICYDSFRFPQDGATTALAMSDEGAHAVIGALLVKWRGARVGRHQVITDGQPTKATG